MGEGEGEGEGGDRGDRDRGLVVLPRGSEEPARLPGPWWGPRNRAGYARPSSTSCRRSRPPPPAISTLSLSPSTTRRLPRKQAPSDFPQEEIQTGLP